MTEIAIGLSVKQLSNSCMDSAACPPGRRSIVFLLPADNKSAEMQMFYKTARRRLCYQFTPRCASKEPRSEMMAFINVQGLLNCGVFVNACRY